MEDSLKEKIKSELERHNGDVDMVHGLNSMSCTREEVLCIKYGKEPKSFTKGENWGNDPKRDAENIGRVLFGIDREIIDYIIDSFIESQEIYDVKNGKSSHDGPTILEVATRLMRSHQETEFGNFMGIKPAMLIELFKSDNVGKNMPFLTKKNPARSLATTLAADSRKDEPSVYRNKMDKSYFFVVDERHALPSIEERKANDIEDEKEEK